MHKVLEKLDERKLKSTPQYRELTFTREAVNQEARTVEIAFASEIEGERWWGIEILDCSAQSVRLARLLNSAPLLYNHDSDDLLGVVEGVSLGTDRVCRATVRFSRNEEAEEAFQDVLDKILTKVSVGYMVHEYVLEKEVEGVPYYRITDWEPYEISMVTLPFDDTVGVGRKFNPQDSPKNPVPEQTPQQTRESGFFNVKIKEQEMEKTIDQLELEGRQLAEKLSASEIETKRREAIISVGARYSEFLTFKDIQRAIDENQHVSQLQDLVIERQKTKHTDTSGQHIGMSDKEVGEYSISRAIAAVLSGDWSKAGLEQAASRAAEEKFKSITPTSSRGFLLPFDVMAKRDFTVGTAAEAGNLVQTTLRDDLFADVLRNELAFGELGATMLFGLTGNLDIPRKTVATSMAFLAETGAATESQPNTGKVTLSAKRISTYVQYSKQAVIQSAMAVEPMLRKDIIDGYAVMFEESGFNGNGTAPNLRGIRNVSGIGSVVGGTNGAQLAWSHICNLESAVANVNGGRNKGNAGYAVNHKTVGWLKQTLKAANFQQFIWNDQGDLPLNGYKAVMTNNVPSNLTKGTSNGVCSSIVYSSAWDMFVLGTFGAVELIVDEITQATNGMNQLILNAFVDAACRRPANFATMDDGLTV